MASGTTNKGTKSRGLFQFDFAGQIPADSVVNAVSVVFTVTGTPPAGGASSTFALHRVLKGWGEGNKTGNIGSASGTDEATWNARMEPSTLWSAPGGAAGDDFVATGSASAQVAGVGQYTFGPSNGLLDDLRVWLQNPELNFGWGLISQSESVPVTARRFGSREAGASAASLIIDFTPLVENEPPVITRQPQSQTVPLGTTAAFSVLAEGTAPLTYQWQLSGSNIPGATGTTLTLADVQVDAEGSYAVVVSNDEGSVTSSPAALTVLVPPSINSPPRTQAVSAGSSVSLQVIASGTEPLSFQWQFNGAEIQGAIDATLSLNNVQSDAAGDYAVVVSNIAGSLASAPATLTVLVSPIFSLHPQSQTVSAGASVVFQVMASGSEPLNYQWQLNGVDVSGATEAAFVLNGVQPEAAGSYTVVVSNAVAIVTSESAVLTVIVPPTIGSEPQSQTIVAGADVTFRVVVSGSEPLGYQWRLNGADIPGATNVELAVSVVQSEAEGSYTVVVSNAAGSVTSAPAQLTVEVVPVSQPRIDRIEFDGNMFTIVFDLEANVGVVVEYAESLSAGVWMSLTTVVAAPDSATVNVSDSVSTSDFRFYRLRVTE